MKKAVSKKGASKKTAPRRKVSKRAVSQRPPVPESSTPVPVPTELVQAVVNRNCVLYAGAGLSARAGLPTWFPFVKGLLD